MKSIVHIDNSGFFRKLMKTFLEKEGFEVESFDSPHEADMAIGSGSADMVIMSLTFADIGGLEFLERIKESYGGPVVVVSSSVNKEKAEELIAKGALAAINKSGGSWQEGLKPHLSALKGQ